MTAFSLKLPGRIEVGPGVTEQVPGAVARLGARRALLVTDPYMHEHGPVASIASSLERAGTRVAIFDDVQVDPTDENVAAGLAALAGHAADCVLAVGGGSAIDCAKAVAVMARNPGGIVDYAGYDRFEHAGLPLVVVPTTAGSGSECTRATVIGDSARATKLAIYDDALLPDTVLVDFRHSMTMPKDLTAHVGIDALVHAVEAYTSRLANAASDMFALEAAGLIGPNLRAVYRDGASEQAREAMMYGSTLAGAAFSNSSVALIHGMSRPIGARFHVPHGLSNALLFSAVVRFSCEAATGRYAQLARTLGVARAEDSDDRACEALLSEFASLVRDLEIPSLRELGVESSAFEGALVPMAEAALASGSVAFNPRVASRDEIVQLYREVY